MSTILEHAQSGTATLDQAKANLAQNFAIDNPALAELHGQIDSARLALSEIEKLAEAGFSGSIEQTANTPVGIQAGGDEPPAQSIESGPVSEAQLDATAPPSETTPVVTGDESATTEQATSDAAPETTSETTA